MAWLSAGTKSLTNGSESSVLTRSWRGESVRETAETL